jgi:hypothetical protein
LAPRCGLPRLAPGTRSATVASGGFCSLLVLTFKGITTPTIVAHVSRDLFFTDFNAQAHRMVRNLPPDFTEVAYANSLVGEASDARPYQDAVANARLDMKH